MSLNNRQKRAKIAEQTLKILEVGGYTNLLGNYVEIKESVDFCIKNAVLYSPKAVSQVYEEIKKINDKKCGKIEISNETTLEAARRLVESESVENTVCLNFASAKNPGGGFLGGSHAQEESLARASALYPSIVQMKEMYDYNWGQKTFLYSDYMIYSPQVPVFRDDACRLLEKPYETSFITAPAVNAGMVREREHGSIEKMHEVMERRIRYILSVAAVQCKNTIILGAFGCGVFKNRAEDVAGYFQKILLGEGMCRLFDKIVFAIYESDERKEKIQVFRKAFEQ